MKKVFLIIILIMLMLSNLMGVASEEIDRVVQSGDLPELQILLGKEPTLLALKDDRGRTLLHRTAAFGHVEMARWLIDRGAGIDARTAEMSTPLMHAALSGKTEMVRLLIVKGADLAARDGYQRTALILVARERGDVEMAGVLLDAGADINAVDRFDDSSLSLAAWRGFTGLVDLLVERGAKLSKDPGKRREVFSLAVAKGLDRLFDRFIAKGIKLQEAGEGLLHSAANGGSEHILKKLFAAGFTLNARDGNGWTPLHLAAERGHARAVALLIEHGARLNERTLAGETPYNLALNEKNEGVVALLKAKGADQSPPAFPVLAGEYLGQKKPGAKPELFAPGIVSSRFGLHCSPVFSPDGREVYWNVMNESRTPGASAGRLLVSYLRNGRWTYPQIAPFTGTGRDADVPFFTFDGKRLYFLSRRPLPPASAPSGEHIWFMERQGDGWSEPRPIDDTVNRLPLHWQFAVDKDYNLYLHANVSGGLGENDLYFAKHENGRYLGPINLGAPLNTPGREEMPFIAPDGSYLLFQRDFDLYVSFRGKDGSWGEPVNLGPEINSPAIDICPVVSPDGKFIFFLSQRGGESHAWWVSAAVLAAMKPKNSPKQHE